MAKKKGYRPKRIDMEWSYWFDTQDLEGKPVSLSFAADEEQCKALARRFGVDTVHEAQAEAEISRVHEGVVYVSGTVRARLTQLCVVSLEPMDVVLEESFEGWFADDEGGPLRFAKAKQEREARKTHAEVEMLDESDDPEPMVDGHIDVGELATQYLSLAVDPNRHKDGVVFEAGDEQAHKPAPRQSPFDKLKEWKEKR